MELLPDEERYRNAKEKAIEKMTSDAISCFDLGSNETKNNKTKYTQGAICGGDYK